MLEDINTESKTEAHVPTRPFTLPNPPEVKDVLLPVPPVTAPLPTNSNPKDTMPP
jgi:hypothetical protein